MARPRKTGLEYFPMDCSWDEKARSFESVFKNDGFVWLVKFWQAAYQAEDGCVDFDGIFGVIHPENSRITPGKHLEMLAFAINIGLIFKNSQGLYTSNGIQKRIIAVTGDREKDRIRKEKEFSDGKPPGKPPEKGGNANANANVNAKRKKDIKTRNAEKPAHSFKDSEFYDFNKFREALPEWSEAKAKHYYGSAVGGDEAKGYKYKSWIAAVRNWERMDIQRGTPFREPSISDSVQKPESQKPVYHKPDYSHD